MTGRRDITVIARVGGRTEVGVERDFNPKPILISVLALMLTANIMAHTSQKALSLLLAPSLCCLDAVAARAGF